MRDLEYYRDRLMQEISAREKAEADVEQYKTHAKEEMLRCREYMAENEELLGRLGKKVADCALLQVENEGLKAFLNWLEDDEDIDIKSWEGLFEFWKKQQTGGGE